jgi:hypothetical protein
MLGVQLSLSSSHSAPKDHITSRAQQNAYPVSSMQLVLITGSIYRKLTHKSQKIILKNLNKNKKYRTACIIYICGVRMLSAA